MSVRGPRAGNKLSYLRAGTTHRNGTPARPGLRVYECAHGITNSLKIVTIEGARASTAPVASGRQAPLATSVNCTVRSAPVTCGSDGRQRLALYLVKPILLAEVHVLAESAYEVHLTDAATTAQFQ